MNQVRAFVFSWLWLWVLAGLGLAQAQSSGTAPQQGQHSTPQIVRKEYDMARLATPPALSDAELGGRRLFLQRCGICHDPVGQRTTGPWLDQTTLATMGEAAARQMIAEGTRRMPGFQYALQPAQIDEILAFLKKVSPDQRPQPPVGATRGSPDS